MWTFGNSNLEGMPTFKVDDSVFYYDESFVYDYSSGYYHANIIAYGRVLAPITGIYTFFIKVRGG